jgi:hypothetical protein
MISAATQASTLGTAGAVFTILASAVLVVGGIAALVKAIWKVASKLTDNTRATATLSASMADLGGKLDEFKVTMDGRVGSLESRVAALEHPPA